MCCFRLPFVKKTHEKLPILTPRLTTRALIIKFRKERPSLGYCYVVSYLNQQGCTEIPSAATVYAIWKKNKLLKRHYKKSEKKKDCRAIKQKYLAFEKIQIDVKELTDIPNYLEQSSEHPLAEAIVEGVKERGIALSKTEDFASITGQGVTGVVDGVKVAIGNAKLLKSETYPKCCVQQ